MVESLPTAREHHKLQMPKRQKLKVLKGQNMKYGTDIVESFFLLQENMKISTK